MSADRHRPGAGEPLRLVHHHPGRLRMRAEVFIDGEDLVAHVRKALERLAGILQVTHNVQSGSLLVEYEPGTAEPDAMLNLVARAAGLTGVVDEATYRAQRFDPAGTVIAAVRGLDRVALEATGGRADLPALVPAALAGAAVFSLVFDKNGPAWPRWDNLAWWAYSTFLHWHGRQIQRVASEPGVSGS